MFLFIFESIGTSELILVGIIALIFLGPRKLPEIARKIGKITAEFRGTANEFKETWQREVDFEDEAKALSLDAIDAETVSRGTTPDAIDPEDVPAVREVDPESISHLMNETGAEVEPESAVPDPDVKQNWL